MEKISNLKILSKLIFLLFVTETLSQTTQAPTNGAVRLVGPGSTPYRGRVEVYHVNRWRTIAKSTFSQAEANVTCKQLGYVNGGTALNSSVFGIGTGYIWGFQCAGYESSVYNCIANAHNTNASNSHLDDAGVECRTQHSNGDVRIIEDSGLRGAGFVEVFFNGSWGAVCNVNWYMNNARVICGQLGYNTTFSLAGTKNSIKYLTWPAVTKQFAVSDVICTGLESSLAMCQYSRADPALCNATKPNNYATVSCVPLPNDIPNIPIPTLSCDKNISASFSKDATPTLLETHLSLASGAVPCKLKKYTNATHVTVSMGFFDCGTSNTSNTTHITYTNALVYKFNYHMPSASLQQYVKVENTHTINLMCHIWRTVTASQCLEPNPQTINQSSTTSLKMRMELYLDGYFNGQPANFYPLQVTLNQLLGVKLILGTNDRTLKLVRHNCWVTPDSNSNHTLRHPLFENKCPTVNDLAFFAFNDKVFGFNYNVFKFEMYNTTCIHCLAYVCLTSENTGQCDPRCDLGRRKKREIGSRNEREAGDPCRRRREAGHQEMVITSPIIQIVAKPKAKLAANTGITLTREESKAPLLKMNILYSIMLILSAILML